MAKVNNENLTAIKKLYRSGFSIREIAEKYSVPLNAMVYFFRKNKIKRRSGIESNRILFNRKEASFSVKRKLSNREKELKMMGIMLYWGEGSKWKGEKIVDLANSDSSVIKIFLCFLREVCQIDESRLRIYLYCFSSQDVVYLIDFWSRITKIDKKKFYKPYIKKVNKADKIGKMKYGLIHIRYNDKKLLDQIRMWIKEFRESYS